MDTIARHEQERHDPRPRISLISKGEMVLVAAEGLRQEVMSLLPHKQAYELLRGRAVDSEVDDETGRKLQALMPSLARHLKKYGPIPCEPPMESCSSCGGEGELTGNSSPYGDPQEDYSGACSECESEVTA